MQNPENVNVFLRTNPTFIHAVYDVFFNKENYFNANGEAKLFWHYYFMLVGDHWLDDPKYKTNSLFLLPISYFKEVNELLNIIHDIVQYSRMYFNASTSHFDYGLRLCSAWWVPFVIMVIGLVALILTIVATALETCRVLTGLIIASLKWGEHKVAEIFIGAQHAQSMKENDKESAEFLNECLTGLSQILLIPLYALLLFTQKSTSLWKWSKPHIETMLPPRCTH